MARSRPFRERIVCTNLLSRFPKCLNTRHGSRFWPHGAIFISEEPEEPVLVESYRNGAAADAVIKAAGHLTGLESCSLTVLHPPGLQRMVCAPAGFGDDVVVVRTSLRLNRECLVQVGIGKAMIIFGTVREVSANGTEPGFLNEVAITSAFIRQT